ncbi:MAG: deoxyribodipyrimidine photolyase [Actinomycetota bacterium]|nr:deoxyribodipyrimidine photolyase [Actinomycetota bacterium]
MTSLPVPELTPDRAGVVQWVSDHLGDLASGDPSVAPVRGGQQAADAALHAFDVTGYARRRNNVLPERARGASGLSPYIRHGLLQLPRVHEFVAGGPSDDVEKFRDELLWQEYARHLYARLGDATKRSLRYSVREDGPPEHNPWDTQASCLQESWQELTQSGYLTNQARMWLASHWTVREGWGWRDGEDLFFRHLLDGSRAANRSGWQWTVGALTGKPYGFSRWQVRKRAPELCDRCPLSSNCPIEDWPDEEIPEPRSFVDPRMRRDEDVEASAGPQRPITLTEPEFVWITAESLGDDDPALQANPDLPVVFVFDEPLLRRLRLSYLRLVFLAEALADLAERRTLRIYRGDVSEVLASIGPFAVTFTPVPGWRRVTATAQPSQVHPWPWLRRPHAGSITSFTAWSRSRGDRR